MTWQSGQQSSWASALDEQGPGPVELDGLRVVFDQKVGLHPADLQKPAVRPARRPPPPARSGAMALGRRHGRR